VSLTELPATAAPATSAASPGLRGPEDRWRPVRAGVVRVWQYAEETLEFEDGRLLLFGANGSGKTMLLEVLLPFLLDAKQQPGRLSTSGADRGGLWDRVVGYESGQGRVGYLWVTFGRTVDGRGEHFTCGTRLRAQPSGKDGDHCWFTTSLAPTVDLHLLDEHRRPLDVDRLTEAIGEHGTIWRKDTAGYRDAVRTTLFAGFNPLRLEALISALLVVRKQSVTDGLSAERLNDLLREGLPPLDDDEVAKLARGFEELDRRRDRITTMTADVAAARAIRQAARTYARAVVAAHADQRVAAETEKDNVTRKEREAAQALERAVAEQHTTEEELRATEAELAALEARLAALRSSEAFRSAGALQELREHADAAARQAAAAGHRAEQAREQAETVGARAADLGHQAEVAHGQVTSAVGELLETADAAVMHIDTEVEPNVLAQAVDTQVGVLKHAVRRVTEALRQLELAVTARDGDQRNVEVAQGRLDAARDALDDAEDAAAAGLHAWRDEVAAWAAGLELLDAGQLTVLTADVDAPAAVHDAAREAYGVVADRIATRREQLRSEESGVEVELAELVAELDRLRGGGVEVPPAPPHRRDRVGLGGAPFWQLVGFGDGVDEATAAGTEAALAATGLLDAWVGTDGRVDLDLDDVDVVLGSAAPSAAGRSLREVCVPEPDAAVPEELVTAILARIGWSDSAIDAAAGEGEATGVVVAADGTYRVGPAHGRAHVEVPARFLGAVTRERNRLARVATLESSAQRFEATIAELRTEQGRLDERRRAAAAERDAAHVPAEATLDEARRTVGLAVERLDAAAGVLADADETLAAAEEHVRRAQRRLNLLASEHGLPTSREALDARQDLYDTALRQVRTVEQRHQRHRELTSRADEAAGRATEATAAAEAADGEAQEEALNAASKRARYDELERTAGADARSVLADIAREEGDGRALTRRQTTARSRQREVDARVGSAREIQDQATELRQAAERRRDAAHEAVRRVVAAGLATDAGIEVAANLAGVTGTLEAAQAVRAAVGTANRSGSVVANALARLGEQVHRAGQQLAGRADLALAADEEGDFSVLLARVEGEPLRAPALQARFEEQLSKAERELTEREERVFEETLTGAVRDHLADRIRTSTATVRVVNELLDRVETAAGGVKVQLRWDVDGDEVDDQVVLKRIKELLLGRRHTAEEQAELHAFLRRQIDKVRSLEGDTGRWQDRLARVLDYRLWHRFTVLVHHDRFADKPVPFGSRKVQLSAGEKTVALTVPLIAAIAAHYLPRRGEQDVPACPRLLLMDELFPKVDRPNKRLLLGLINDLGLDVVFTSDKDWCDYDTLDAIAIHVVQKDGDASLTTRFVWNGRERAPAPVTHASDSTLLSLLEG
jgi:uncharacterized protein (TIGR02680 family)